MFTLRYEVKNCDVFVYDIRTRNELDRRKFKPHCVVRLPFTRGGVMLKKVKI